jgi:hypothetical protein
MHEMNQAEVAECALTARRVELGEFTPDDVTRVAIILKDIGYVRSDRVDAVVRPRLDSADDFDALVVIPRHGEIVEIYRDQSETEHVVAYHETGLGSGRGQSRSLGRALWAAFIRTAACLDADGDEDEVPADPVDPSLPRVHLVTHRYQIGDLSVAIEVPACFDAARVAGYIQLGCEEWHDQSAVLLPQTVVEAMIRFYGCRPAPVPASMRDGDEIDLYWERERFCGEFNALMADASLAREGLRDFLADRYDA